MLASLWGVGPANLFWKWVFGIWFQKVILEVLLFDKRHFSQGKHLLHVRIHTFPLSPKVLIWQVFWSRSLWSDVASNISVDKQSPLNQFIHVLPKFLYNGFSNPIWAVYALITLIFSSPKTSFINIILFTILLISTAF